MKKAFHAPSGKSVVAVSGGVDSMVLLDLMHSSKAEFVVAHFVHGVRSTKESQKDIDVISAYCEPRSIAVHTASYDKEDTSEAALRDARYAFLERVKQESNSNIVITAHHHDDRIETAIINLLRGTQGAGVDGLKSGVVARPLIAWSKADILAYAKERKLHWHEDSTNNDVAYLRNYVRRVIVPKMNDAGTFTAFAEAVAAQQPIQAEMELLMQHMKAAKITQEDNGYSMERSWFIQLPHAVSKAVLHSLFSEDTFGIELNARSVDKAVVFAKTAKPKASLDLSKTCSMYIELERIKILAKA